MIEGAFYSCSNLAEVTFLGKTGSIAASCFDSCNENIKFNVFSDSSAEAWAIANNYKYELINMEETTLTDFQSKISVSLFSEQNAELKVEKIAEDSQDYEELLQKVTEGRVYSAYSISVENGKYLGNIKLTFTVNENYKGQYEGKKAIILHKKANGEIETFEEIVTNGKVTITTTELSPFMLAVIGVQDELGDINQDGKVNARDAKLALQCYVEKIKLTDEQKAIGDVNKDGKVNARDAKLILQYYVGKIKKF